MRNKLSCLGGSGKNSFIAGQFREIMYRKLTKGFINQTTGLLRCASMTSSPTCPSQLAPTGQTSNICTKLINAQVGCVTNVESYSFYACTFVAGVRDISKLVCYYLVLFAAVTQLQHFEVKKNTFAASEFHNIANIHVGPMIYYACAHTLLEH